MGRPRKPLAMQKKHLTIEEKILKEQSEEIITVGREQLNKTPTWLIDNFAKKEFKRIIKEFNKIDIVGNLDLNNIGGYCNAYSNYLKATKQLKNEELIIEKILPNGAITKAENPLIKVQKLFAEEMRKFSSLCGLTIDSRLKIATTKVTKKEQDIDDTFGDI